jgi:hypothetical protein
MEVILTDEEQAASDWLAWDDETVGKAVRAFALIHGEKNPGQQLLWAYSCSLMLASLAAEAGSETTTHAIQGVTRSGEPVGDWLVTVQRLTEPVPEEPPAAEWDGDKLARVSFNIADGKVAAPDLAKPKARGPWTANRIIFWLAFPSGIGLFLWLGEWIGKGSTVPEVFRALGNLGALMYAVAVAFAFGTLRLTEKR